MEEARTVSKDGEVAIIDLERPCAGRHGVCKFPELARRNARISKEVPEMQAAMPAFQKRPGILQEIPTFP